MRPGPKVWARRALAASMLLTLSLSRAVAGPMVTDLGDFKPVALDDAGRVLGVQVGRDAWGNAAATGTALWDRGATTAVDDPAAGLYSSAGGLSRGGVVAFTGYTDHASMSAHVSRGGTTTDLGVNLEGASWQGGFGHSQATGVNDSGEVVGTARATLRDNHAFISTDQTWGNGRKMLDLGTLGGKNSIAMAINNNGDVVGQADTGSWSRHAFQGGGRGTSASMWDLGTLGGKNSGATAINDKGQVVGFSNIQDAGTARNPTNPYVSFASFEATHAFLYQDGKMQDLGTLPGFRSSYAMGINARGQVVGTASDADWSPSEVTGARGGPLGRAFLFRNGAMEDLNAVLPAASGWVLESATAINDDGQILGMGRYQGQERSYLLALDQVAPSPIPEPTALALLAVAGAGLAARRVRRRMA